jgi:hypothetical protein
MRGYPKRQRASRASLITTFRMSSPVHPSNAACLQSINFSLLKSGEASEISRLLQACQINGFFYLNLEDDAHAFLLDLAKALALLTKFYDEPLDVKLQSYKGEGLVG